MGKNWAIAIGINQYRYLQPLHYAVQDAIAMRDYFADEVSFENVYYFADNSPPIPQDYGPPLDSVPTFTTLKRFLRSRFDQPFLQTGDNLWFFFAGHGVRHEDRDYLMPLDGDPGAVEETAIPKLLIPAKISLFLHVSRGDRGDVWGIRCVSRVAEPIANGANGRSTYPTVPTASSIFPRDRPHATRSIARGRVG